jgi:choice-of-anchor C domain-containing protein
MVGPISRLVVGAVLLLPVSVHATAIKNGNFTVAPCGQGYCTEYAGSTAITSWSVLSGSVDDNITYWQSPPLGGNSVDLDGLSPGALAQSFGTAPGGSYRVNFYMSGNPDPSPPLKTMEVKAGTFDDTFSYDTAAHGLSGANHNVMNYVAESFIFTATGSPTSLQFISTDPADSGRGPVIGNVSITPLPPDGEYQIHAFTGATVNVDGAQPRSQLVPDGNGNLFGTTTLGGANRCPTDQRGGTTSCGTVFSLVRNAAATAWTEQVLYSFNSTAWEPSGRLTYSKRDGVLYGTAQLGGGKGCGGFGCGAVMQFTAPTDGSSSTPTVLYQFHGATDGGMPNAHLVQDQATGALYGTARWGRMGDCSGVGCGLVFMLTPPASGTTWTETVLYRFTGGNDGGVPFDINRDSAGNIYGTTSNGGAYGKGVVFKLAQAGTGVWHETVLHAFQGGNDGAVPVAGVIIDQSGNLYGTTTQGGSANCSAGCGTVYELTPPTSGTAWPEAILYRFRGLSDGQNPQANLILDSAGALYGTTAAGGSSNCTGGCGTVFKLTAPATGTTWTETILHRFLGNDDGAAPVAGLHMDSAGHLTGTTAAGGGSNLGTAFQVQ